MKSVKRSIIWLLIITVVFTFTNLNVFAASDKIKSSVSEQIISADAQ